jgi:hypothetical protein
MWSVSAARNMCACHQRLLAVSLRISKIVKTTPKVSVAAVNVNVMYPGQLNPNQMLSIPAAIDALYVATKHAMVVALTGLPAS